MMADPEISDPPAPNEEQVANDYTPANNPCGGFLPGDPNNRAGHGTAVASVIAGKTVGVAKHTTIVPVKVGNCAGEISRLAMARGLDWIQLDMQARRGVPAVVNMSVWMDMFSFPNILCEDGAGGLTNCASAVEHEVNDLISANITVVTSANNQNNGNCTTSPARMGYGNETNFPSPGRTITVGGTLYELATYNDQRWTCAAQPGGCDPIYGPSDPGSNYGPCVSIWAPAWNINVAGAANANSFRTGYGARSGTSFAAPSVTGVVARLLERYPSLTPQQVWTELVNRANLRWVVTDFDPSALVNTRLLYMSPFD